MPLCQVTEEDNDAGGEHLGQHRVNMKLFYKDFKENIVQRQVEHTDHEIAEKLYPSLHF